MAVLAGSTMSGRAAMPSTAASCSRSSTRCNSLLVTMPRLSSHGFQRAFVLGTRPALNLPAMPARNVGRSPVCVDSATS